MSLTCASFRKKLGSTTVTVLTLVFYYVHVLAIALSCMSYIDYFAFAIVYAWEWHFASVIHADVFTAIIITECHPSGEGLCWTCQQLTSRGSPQ